MKVTGNRAYVKSDIDLYVNITGVVGKHRNHSYLSHGSNTKEGFGIKALEDRYMSKFFNDSLSMMRESKEYMLSEAEAERKRAIEEAEKRKALEKAEQQRVLEEAERKRVLEEAERQRVLEEQRALEESKKQQMLDEAEKKRILEEALKAAEQEDRKVQVVETSPEPSPEESKYNANAFLSAVMSRGILEKEEESIDEYAETEEVELLEEESGLDEDEETVTEDVIEEEPIEYEGDGLDDCNEETIIEDIVEEEPEGYEGEGLDGGEETLIEDIDIEYEEAEPKERNITHGVYIDLVRSAQDDIEESGLDEGIGVETEEIGLDEELEEVRESEEVSIDEEMETETEDAYPEEGSLDEELEEVEEVSIDEEMETETEDAYLDEGSFDNERIVETEEVSFEEDWVDESEGLSLEDISTDETGLFGESEAPNHEQRSKVVNFPGTTQIAEAKKPEAKKEEEIPRDLRTYIKLHQGCSPADVIKLYSAKELQKAIQIGKVYKRKGRLFV